MAIKKLAEGPKMAKIMDMFAGSGCIGVSLLKRLPQATVDFAEKDRSHIATVQKNLRLNSQNSILADRGNIFESDVFKGIPLKKYDYIFANPPYVSKGRHWTVQESVKKWEPRDAIFASDHGLFYIKKLLSAGREYLSENGTMFIEFDSWQKDEIKKLAQRRGWNVSFWKDQYKKWRVAVMDKQTITP